MNHQNIIKINVNCYSGYLWGDLTPTSISFNGKKIDVSEIIDMLLTPDHRFFKFTGSDGGLYIIRHDTQKHQWELTFFKDQKA